MTALAWAGMMAEEGMPQASHRRTSLATALPISLPHGTYHKTLCPRTGKTIDARTDKGFHAAVILTDKDGTSGLVFADMELVQRRVA